MRNRQINYFAFTYRFPFGEADWRRAFEGAKSN